MKYVLFLSVAATLFLSGCLQREMPSEPTTSSSPALTILEAPDQITFNRSYRISVRVSDAQGPDDVPFVLLSIIPSGSTTPTQVDTLWDDGQSLRSEDGDVIANDGIFTQVLFWPPENTSRQELFFVFKATDKSGHESEPVIKTVISLLNPPPQLIDVSVPSYLPSGFKGELITAKVIDDNAVSVHYYGARKDTAGFEGELVFEGELFDNGENGDVITGDNIFSLSITAEFAAAREGLYTLKFQAEDAVGDTSETVTQEIDIENVPPNIANLNCPDTVQRPTSGTKTVLVTLDVSDAQGLGDIKFVGFMSLKPDSTYANNGQPIPMVDNGLPYDPSRWIQQYWGDVTAGDGVYSFTAEVSSGDTPGDYVWTFQASDWVGNGSDTIIKVFTIQ